MENDKIIELDLIEGITLIDKALFLKALKQLKPKEELTAKITEYLIKIFSPYQRKILTFDHLFQDFEYDLFEKRSTLISTAKKKEIIDEKKITAPSAHPDPQLKWEKGGSIINFQELYMYLKERQWAYCIFISKDDRDHNFKSKGAINPEGRLFKKLVEGLSIEFNESNGRSNIVKRKDKLGFSWQMTNGGKDKRSKLEFWFKDTFSWELVVKDLQEFLEPCDLSIKEFAELIECLMDSEKRRLFRLEVANDISPEHVIETLFNRACLIYQQVEFEGKYYPVLVKIDKSKGPYEIEFIGAYGPTKALQDVTVRAFEVVASLSRFQFIIDNLVQNSVRTHSVIVDVHHTTKDFAAKLESFIDSLNEKLDEKFEIVETGIHTLQQQQILVKEDLLAEVSVVQAKQFGHEIITDLYHTESSTDRKNIIQGIKSTNEHLGQSIKYIEKRFEETEKYTEEKLHENIEPVVEGLSHVSKNIIKTKEKLEKIDKNITKQFTDLKSFLTDNFNTIKKGRKQELYLVLENINRNRALTIKELLNEISLPRSTLLYYLEKLQKENLVKVEIQKNGKRGRPPKIFKSTEKLRELIKKGDAK
jgi:DNA-binding MarR family transcriptional regulator